MQEVGAGAGTRDQFKSYEPKQEGLCLAGAEPGRYTCKDVGMNLSPDSDLSHIKKTMVKEVKQLLGRGGHRMWFIFRRFPWRSARELYLQACGLETSSAR